MFSLGKRRSKRCTRVPPLRKSSLTHKPPSPLPVQHHVVPSPDKWASVVVIPDPADRACSRIAQQRQRDREAEEALCQEEERQRRLQGEHKTERRREQEEEARKASPELEIKRATSERRRRGGDIARYGPAFEGFGLRLAPLTSFL
ncbi:hypothetical protein GGG16DRAFT_115782 [Schizophyllum commune]